MKLWRTSILCIGLSPFLIGCFENASSFAFSFLITFGACCSTSVLFCCLNFCRRLILCFLTGTFLFLKERKYWSNYTHLYLSTLNALTLVLYITLIGKRRFWTKLLIRLNSVGWLSKTILFYSIIHDHDKQYYIAFQNIGWYWISQK